MSGVKSSCYIIHDDIHDDERDSSTALLAGPRSSSSSSAGACGAHWRIACAYAPLIG